MQSRYKVAIFDLDGTLTNSRKELTPRTRQTLLELQRGGVRVVLASGRPIYGIVPLARELELERYGGYILAFNGGVVIECQTGVEISSQRLPHHLLPHLYRDSCEAGFRILSYDQEMVVCESVEDRYVQYEAMLNKMTLHATPSFLDYFREPLYKALAVGDPTLSEAFVERLRAAYGAEMSIYRSEPFFVELVPLGVDKARSLTLLSTHLSIPREEMIAFGDGYNDLSMIEWAGCGVAMRNAAVEVREAADVVTDFTNDEDGVAKAVEKMML